MKLRERKKPNIIKQWQEENLQSKDRVDAIAEEIELKMVSKAIITNCQFEVAAQFNFAIPAIDLFINNNHILSICFQRNGAITTSISESTYRDAYNLTNELYKKFKSKSINGAFYLSNDKELSEFVNSFITKLDVEQIESN